MLQWPMCMCGSEDHRFERTAGTDVRAPNPVVIPDIDRRR